MSPLQACQLITALATAGTLTACRQPQTTNPKDNALTIASGPFLGAPSTTTTTYKLPAPDGPPWYEQFHDSELNSLTSRALNQNFELQQFAARLRQADALLQRERANLFPSLDASASTGRREILSGGGDTRRDTGTQSLGALLGWEIDLWGRLRSGTKARDAALTAAREDLHGSRLLLTASIAELYFQIRERQAQLALLNQQNELNNTLLELTELRFGQGQASSVDILQQQNQRQATIALIPEIEADLANANFALAALLGMTKPPDIRHQDTFPDLPPSPATGQRQDLLHRRPDLRAAHARLTALDANVAEAARNQLPRLTISGRSLLDGSTSLDRTVAEATANILAPIFDTGARRSETNARKAQYEDALAGFFQSYLNALRDVESALANELQLGRRLQGLETQLATATELLNESRARYNQGLTDYLPVIDALTSLQSLERTILTTRRSLFSSRIALHRALGGPFPTTPEPPPTT